jgi:hypothetical protein
MGPFTIIFANRKKSVEKKSPGLPGHFRFGVREHDYGIAMRCPIFSVSGSSPGFAEAIRCH